jgi:hypothetical protein
MFTRAGLLALVCLADLSTAAVAAVPKLSGTYTLTQNSTCPIIATTTQNATGELTSITAPVYGDASGLIGTLTFTPAAGTPDAGTVTGTGYSYETGGLLQLPGGSLQPEGLPLSISSTYTNTATTLTLAGGVSTTYAIYGLVKDGIAQSVSFIGPSLWPKGSATQVTCVGTGTLIRN